MSEIREEKEITVLLFFMNTRSLNTFSFSIFSVDPWMSRGAQGYFKVFC